MRKILIYFVIFCCFISVHDAFAGSSAQVGSISFLEGVCDISSGNGEPVIAAEGQAVYLGDRIRTKNYSKAQITLLDKSVVKAAPSSCVSIEEFRLSRDNSREFARIKLTRGKIEAVVSKTGAPDTFLVDTPNARGTVKGSDIFISYMAGRTAVFVQEGAIAVSPASAAQSAVSVGKGSCIVVPFDRIPSDVRPVMDIEMKQHKKDVERELIRKWIPGNDSARMNAVIVAHSGTVRIYRKDASDWRPVAADDVVSEADKVQTGEDGKAEIRLGNGNVLYMQENTELGFSKLRYDPATGSYENTFEMNEGEVIGVIEKIDPRSTFQLRTPTAVSGVRGTVLRVVVPPPTVNMPVQETRVFFEGGSGVVTSLLTGQTQQLFAGQNAVVNKAGVISPPVVTPANQRIGSGLPMPMGQPVQGYMPGKPFAGPGADMSKPPLPPLYGNGPMGPKPPMIDPSGMILPPPPPPFDQVFPPDVLAQIPFVKGLGTIGTITAANLDLTIKNDGTWNAGLRGDFNSYTSPGWSLRFVDVVTQADKIQFNNIPNAIDINSSGTFTCSANNFVGDIVGTNPDKTLTLGAFSGNYADNHLTAQASGTWTDK